MSGTTTAATDREDPADVPPEAETRPARDVIADAARLLGGAAGLFAWVKDDKKNQEKFWTGLYPRLIALELTGEDSGPTHVAAAIEAARERVRQSRLTHAPREDGA